MKLIRYQFTLILLLFLFISCGDDNNTPNRPMLLPIVLKGRVDCRVVGTISKGDMIGTSHINGVGTRVTSSAASVGIALEDYNSASEGVISVLAK